MEAINLSQTDRILISELTSALRHHSAIMETMKKERVYSCKEAAKVLGVCPQTISRYLAQGRLTKGERDGRVGIPQSQIDDFKK